MALLLKKRMMKREYYLKWIMTRWCTKQRLWMIILVWNLVFADLKQFCIFRLKVTLMEEWTILPKRYVYAVFKIVIPMMKIVQKPKKHVTYSNLYFMTTLIHYHLWKNKYALMLTRKISLSNSTVLKIQWSVWQLENASVFTQMDGYLTMYV